MAPFLSCVSLLKRVTKLISNEFVAQATELLFATVLIPWAPCWFAGVCCKTTDSGLARVAELGGGQGFASGRGQAYVSGPKPYRQGISVC